MLLAVEKRGELRDKRTQDSALRGQMLSALKGMCSRGQESGALNLLPPHRMAIVDLIEKEMLEEVSVGEGWTESYVKDLPWSPGDVLSVYLSLCLSVCLPVSVFVCLCVTVSLCACLSVCLGSRSAS